MGRVEESVAIQKSFNRHDRHLTDPQRDDLPRSRGECPGEDRLVIVLHVSRRSTRG